MTLPSLSPWTALVLVAAIGGITVLGWHDPDVTRRLVEGGVAVGLALAPGLLRKPAVDNGTSGA